MCYYLAVGDLCFVGVFGLQQVFKRFWVAKLKNAFLCLSQFSVYYCD